MANVTENQRLVAVYRKRAAHYDWLSRLYYLIGFRYTGYRKKAVSALDLRRGDTVVEIGCGTGANFSLLQQRIGPEGRIIGVDITDAMLVQARQRTEQAGWDNVKLVRSDAAEFVFPKDIDGVISTYALTLSENYERIIAHGAQALKEGKRWVILDFRAPQGWPRWLVKLGLQLIRPFGGQLKMIERHPWELFTRYLTSVSMRKYFFGTVYIVSGEASAETKVK